MATGMEIIDLIACALTLAFIGRLLISSSLDSSSMASQWMGRFPQGGSREKLSLLNQQVAPKVRFA